MEEGVVAFNIERGKGGKKAKIGDVITIYYQNKLEMNNNIVGRKQNEDGLQFILGNEDASIIRGWHIGIIGMRKGGKRNIICPLETAYGERGLPPFIPPNATVVSEVELLSIKRISDEIEH